MLPRIYYGICQAWQHKKVLHQYLIDPALQLATIFDLTAQAVRGMQIKILILDYDGVLAAHAEPRPRPEAIEWLRHVKADLQLDKIYVLSNQPTPQKQEFFRENFPDISFIVAQRKKPYPDGLQQILAAAAVKPEQALLLDDRLCTGVLAATIVGVKALLITKPYINLRGHPFKELSIMWLRWLEKLLL